MFAQFFFLTFFLSTINMISTHLPTFFFCYLVMTNNQNFFEIVWEKKLNKTGIFSQDQFFDNTNLVF